jgi:hypothetical protein
MYEIYFPLLLLILLVLFTELSRDPTDLLVGTLTFLVLILLAHGAQDALLAETTVGSLQDHPVVPSGAVTAHDIAKNPCGQYAKLFWKFSCASVA